MNAYLASEEAFRPIVEREEIFESCFFLEGFQGGVGKTTHGATAQPRHHPHNDAPLEQILSLLLIT